MSCAQLSRYPALTAGVPPKMRNRAAGSFSLTMANARISVCRSLSGSMRPMKTIVGWSGSASADGNDSGATPLYIVHMRAADPPLRSCQRRL